MNFILISPHFPKTYHQFATALKKNGFNVLGIGDAPYYELSNELKASLTEYYYCPGMVNYSDLFKAVAFLSFKYGKIDWLESNNEFWLERDAKLRTDFNITTGEQTKDILRIKAKSAMKTYYQIAGVPTARYCIADTLEIAQTFINKVGYPVFVKPDIGVGANHSFRINSDQELLAFMTEKGTDTYIMEEFIDGTIVSFDGVANSKSEVVFYVSHVFPIPNHIVVNEKTEDYYYTVTNVPEDLARLGRATIKAFGIKQRFFHLEFFRLNNDRIGLGKKNEIVALEVNMRPAGGYTPEMINFATGVSCHQVWADVMAFDENHQPSFVPGRFCGEVARRKEVTYVHTHEEILLKYKTHIVMEGVYPPIISVGMGDQYYLGLFDSIEQIEEFFAFVKERVKQTASISPNVVKVIV